MRKPTNRGRVSQQSDSFDAKTQTHKAIRRVVFVNPAGAKAAPRVKRYPPGGVDRSVVPSVAIGETPHADIRGA
ncbi:MAG: hypothetical protein ACF8CQ_07190 [Rhodopirellula sp. JB044]|uniref:hypothetical protein n=1 Tax=Rhodopirellula sp. JB044 TaxID=3342844 RepID=UPI00370BC04B